MIIICPVTAGASRKEVDQGGQWRSLGERLHQLNIQIQHSENALAFSFIEVGAK